MPDDPTVVALVVEARDGSQHAWNAIVDRYAPLVWSICRRHDLGRPDIDDVAQSVWLKLVEHLADIRDPAALPGWIATTTRNECLRVLRSGRSREQAEHRADPEPYADGGYAEIEYELERAQRQVALRMAFRDLRPRCQELLSQLFQEPRPAYRDISATLGMKVGSIGPSRERCLAELRRCPALKVLIEADGVGSGNGNGSRGTGSAGTAREARKP
jgi:RNA polymerase sigma factor (sigma-70 family)